MKRVMTGKTYWIAHDGGENIGYGCSPNGMKEKKAEFKLRKSFNPVKNMETKEQHREKTHLS